MEVKNNNIHEAFMLLSFLIYSEQLQKYTLSQTTFYSL